MLRNSTENPVYNLLNFSQWWHFIKQFFYIITTRIFHWYNEIYQLIFHFLFGGKEHFLSPQESSWCPPLGNNWPVHHVHNSVISRMLYKQNHKICGLGLFFLFFPPSIIPWRFIWAMCVHTLSFSLLSMLHGMDVPCLFSDYLVKDIRVVSSFGSLWIRLLWPFVCRCWCKHKF